MTGENLFCPVEECDANRGGYCSARQDGPPGMLPAMTLMAGQWGVMAPMGQAGVPFNMAGHAPHELPEWGSWENCPRRRFRNPRK